MDTSYPVRPPHFDRVFLRAMIERHAANTIGTDGCLLLVAVVLQEDAQRYSGPVDFWNGQLIAALGIKSVDTLDRVRKKCIKAGWLNYTPGSRSRAPRYWVNDPERTPRQVPQNCGSSSPSAAKLRHFTRSERGTSLPDPSPKDIKDIPASAGREAGQNGNPKPAPKKKPVKTKAPNPMHRPAVDAFTVAWKAKYGRDYCFGGGKDGKAVTFLLGAVGNDLDRFQALVGRYLADTDSFVMKNAHNLGTLQMKVNTYLGPATQTATPAKPAYHRDRQTTYALETLLSGLVPPLLQENGHE